MSKYLKVVQRVVRERGPTFPGHEGVIHSRTTILDARPGSSNLKCTKKFYAKKVFAECQNFWQEANFFVKSQFVSKIEKILSKIALKISLVFNDFWAFFEKLTLMTFSLFRKIVKKNGRNLANKSIFWFDRRFLTKFFR